MYESADSPSVRALQPLLHDVVMCVAAPSFAASPRDGQLRGLSAAGFYGHDRRLLHTACLLIDGREPEPIGVQPLGPDHVRFTSVHRYPGDRTNDPTVIIERVRSAGEGESILLRNVGTVTRRLHVELALATDLADIADVKQGLTGTTVHCTAVPDPPGLDWRSRTGRAHVRVTGPAPVPEITDGPEGGTLTWPWMRLLPGESRQIRLTVSGSAVPDPPGHPRAPTAPAVWSEPVVRGDRRLVALVRQGLGDLRSLRLADPERTDPEGPEDQFIAAGCPWYLTLFGRDSIWSARMLLPLGTDLARGTLWALARRQGTAHDVFREEAPGRILHELRPADVDHGNGLFLPSRYYGSVDATPLFVTLLVEAWHWGLPDTEVDALLPYAERAMDWVVGTSAADEDGLLRYYPRQGGLRHQSWKDSEDAVRDAAGRRIEPPLALCEVQGYAYEAATGLAELLRTRGRHDRAERLQTWAEALRKRFSDAFWLSSPHGPADRYVAIAVGRDLKAVSGPASNMGQLLSTGILDPDGCRTVAAWLASPELNSGWGLRSRSADLPGFNPLSYHGGSVWTHDTAIAVQGLCAAGCHEAAHHLANGLLDAASHFEYRMPELYGGDARTPDSPAPLAYPAACRPQGWSAASGVAVLGALLGLRPHVPTRTLRVAPMPVRAKDAGPMIVEVEGMRLAGRPLSIRVDPATGVSVESLPAGWRCSTG
ncbi:glycogen debranching N-terminal domain-containing protein [Streptomyces sp. S.PB5]|uniref:glycogen debranching N-terminal domain-containing protein n=1 Tax=Streptomyces sp. S.PB5 TaxID=3020844 RepID=UPI0025B1E5C8|nr:glycogen debranching N-terminal domain-containing protein [Streptomyces sp. S.PB5]MDN3021063.1 glycogen debranching N-terminal domain-containing protein [Streptomyces sp. S.PB5]